MIRPDSDKLEADLRRLLAPVELVCDADIPSDLIDAAEEVASPLLASEQFDRLAARYPAITVTFLVCRGSERYSRNAFWPHVGVIGRSSDAGRAFLASLDALSLPDFDEFVEKAGARRYVAPILIHGALPSSVAYRLVERVEQELRRGLVDGAEARRRLLNDPEIELQLRRPAARLLEWCPEYADRLLDALIDHIENPTGAGLARLPAHLQHALTTNSERRVGLRRLTPPALEFFMWSGFGPEVVGAGDVRWSIDLGDGSIRLDDGERIEIPPLRRVTAASGGRILCLTERREVLYFDHSGRPIQDDQRLPSTIVAVLPRDWSFTSVAGAAIEEEEEGIPLSGAWSKYRSCSVRLVGHTVVCVGPSDDRLDHREQRSVDDSPVPTLVGEIVHEAWSTVGGAVYRSHPRLIISGSSRLRPGAWFTPVGGSTRHIVLDRSDGADDTYVLGSLGPGAFAGDLQIRESGVARATTVPFAVVPGLEITVPSAPLGPSDTSTVLAVADHGILSSEGLLPVGATVAHLDLDVIGLPPSTVKIALPRVQWALRSARLARLELASGEIEIGHEDLVKEQLWLNVRCGRASSVGLLLSIDGREAQRVQSRQTKSTGRLEHHRSIALDELRDSIRAHADGAIEIAVVVDGHRFVAVTTGRSQTRPSVRSWSERPAAPNVDDKFADVPWLQGQPYFNRDGTVAADHELEQRLRQLSGDDAVVHFLRALGHRHATWKYTEFPNGRSGLEWRQLMAAADALWRIDGVRLRDFTGDVDERLARWARTRRESVRRAPDSAREEVEAWLLGRAPSLERLVDWPHRKWLDNALPPKSPMSCQWLPATVLYHCIALVAGHDDSGPVVASAIDLDPALVLEVVAFLMQVLHSGERILAPILTEALEQEEPDGDGTTAEAAPRLPDLKLSQCLVEVHGDVIEVTAATESATPLFRLSRRGKALAVLHPQVEGLVFALPRPPDVHGTVELCATNNGLLGPLESGVEIHLPPIEASEARRPVTLSDPSKLNEARLDALLSRIAALAGAGQLAQAEIEELFEDERAAATALARLPQRWGPSPSIEAVSIVVLPTALLFDDLGHATPEVVSPRYRLLYAAIGPRHPMAWHRIGWPNPSHFSSQGQPLQDLIGFASKLARRSDPMSLPRTRYAPAANYPSFQAVNRTVQQLDGAVTNASFIDLMVAAHRMVAVDALVPEATRLLLAAHRRHPDAAVNAVLAGVALYLATRSLGGTH